MIIQAEEAASCTLWRLEALDTSYLRRPCTKVLESASLMGRAEACSGDNSFLFSCLAAGRKCGEGKGDPFSSEFGK